MRHDGNDDYACQTMKVHPDIVARVLETTPDEEFLYDLADLFKVLGDSTRMKIIHALLISEMCVCDLSAITGSSQSAVSHQLKVLRQNQLVKFRKEGKTAFYSLKDEHVEKLVSLAKEHLSE